MHFSLLADGKHDGPGSPRPGYKLFVQRESLQLKDKFKTASLENKEVNMTIIPNTSIIIMLNLRNRLTLSVSMAADFDHALTLQN